MRHSWEAVRGPLSGLPGLGNLYPLPPLSSALFNFTSGPLYSRERTPYSLHWRLRGSQRGPGHWEICYVFDPLATG